MRKTLIILLVIMNMHAMAQVTAYDVSKDKENGDLVFNGPVTFGDLNKEVSFTWLQNGMDGYRPDAQAISFLKGRLKEYTLVVFLGTWCDDSHYLIPKLEKVLQQAGYPLNSVTMYGVDREKTTKNGQHKKYNITLVPTIILFKDGREAGRITETVMKSVEWDLTKIIGT